VTSTSITNPSACGQLASQNDLGKAILRDESFTLTRRKATRSNAKSPKKLSGVMQFPAMSSPKGPVERSLNEYPSPACRLIPVAQMEEILESLERKDLRRRN
jgi:hypothetical protein